MKKIYKISIMIMVVFLANYFNSFAEDWKTLRAKVDSYYQQGQYEVAIEYAQKALKQAEKEFGKENIYYADTQNYLALLYQNLGQYTKAEPFYIASMKIFKKKLGDGHPYYGTAVFNLGYSNPINFDLPDGIDAAIDKNKVILRGIDKDLLGRTAARIRGLRPPEPYKGKGVKYSDENIRRKAGKAGAK